MRGESLEAGKSWKEELNEYFIIALLGTGVCRLLRWPRFVRRDFLLVLLLFLCAYNKINCLAQPGCGRDWVVGVRKFVE